MRFCLVIYLLGLLSIHGNSYAQIVENLSAFDIAMSGADITSDNEWSGLQNPAALANYRYTTLGVSYHNRFLIPELGSQLFCATVATKKGTFLPVLSYFGSKRYNQSSLSIAYGLELSSWLDMGINMGYHRIVIEAGSRTSSAISGDIGLIIRPVERIALGVLLINPTQTRFNDASGEYLPGSLQLGFSYSEEKQFCLTSQFCWVDFVRLSCAFGSEYQLFKLLSLRAGVRFPDITTYSFGMGWTFDRLSIDLGFEQHPWLGLSSVISLSYKIR